MEEERQAHDKQMLKRWCGNKLSDVICYVKLPVLYISPCISLYPPLSLQALKAPKTMLFFNMSFSQACDKSALFKRLPV